MTTATPVLPSVRSSADLTSSGLTFPRLLRAEWTKFWSVRSTLWTLVGTFVVTVGFSALVAWGVSSHFSQRSPMERSTFDPILSSMMGLVFGQLTIAVLGALIISAEYTTGGIRSTLVAAPRRLHLLAAKAAVLLSVSFVVGLLACLTCFFVGQAYFSGVGVEAQLGDPGVLRAVVGGALYVAGSAMVGFALGSLLRHSAAAITAAIGLLLVAPNLMSLLPGQWGHSIDRWFTANAGHHVMEVVHLHGDPTPWTGYLAFTAEWAVVALLAGWLVQRRDA